MTCSAHYNRRRPHRALLLVPPRSLKPQSTATPEFWNPTGVERVDHVGSAAGAGGPGTAEIDVHKSTAFRLLGALEGRGLVEQAGDRGKYRLGVGLIPLAGAVSDRLDVTRQGRHVCERLAAELGETVNVAVLHEQWAVNVDQARGPSTVSTHNWWDS